MTQKKIYTFLWLFLFALSMQGQTSIDSNEHKNIISNLLTPSESYSKQRRNTVLTFWGTSYGAFSYGLYQSWYKNQNLQPFHFFNDKREWLQIDKAGHAFSGYFQMAYNFQLSKWAGISEKKSILYSSVISNLFLTTLEVFDGFGEGWGFSAYDMVSNISGSGTFISQQLIWGEQRVLIKESVRPVRYSNQSITVNGVTTSLEERANDLYGKGLLERALKDYNTQTYWLSVSPNAFGWNKWPSWLNISAGIGAQGMFGGLRNRWTTPNGVFDYFTQPRYRQFYLAPDINLSKIKIKSPFLKTLFNAANIIKTPTPALEYNRIEGFKVYLVFF